LLRSAIMLALKQVGWVRTRKNDPPSPIDRLRALSPSTMLGTLSRFDKLKAPSPSRGLPNGLVETAQATV
jgi:hypothetical protein